MANFSRIIVSVISFSLIFAIATSSVAVAITDDERVVRYRKNYDFHRFSKCLFFGITEERAESQLDHIEPSLFVNTCGDDVIESFFSRGLGVSTKGKSVSGLFESLGYQKKQNTANQTIFWEHSLIRGYTPGSNDAKKSAEIQRDVIGKLANAHGLQTQTKTVVGLQVLEIVLIDSPDMERGRMITQLYNDGCEHVDKGKELLGDVTQSPPEGSDLSLQLARVGKGKEWEGYRYFIVSQTDGKRLLYRYNTMIDGYSHRCIDRLEGELSRNAIEFVARAALADAEEKLTPIICAGKSSRDLETCKQSIRNSWQACTKPKAIQGGVRQGELVAPSTALIADCLKGKYPNYDEKITESLIAGTIPSAPVDGGAETVGEEGPSCNIEGGLGWLICPAMTFIAWISDGAYLLVSGLLEVEPSLLNTDTRRPERPATYTAWGVFRNIANVAFIIIFLIVIFSQVSSVGISNYGIKRIMPRLIIGAILINASFFISQLAVDLSNIAGGSLKGLLEAAGSSAIGGTPPASWQTIVAMMLGGTLTIAIAGAAAAIAIGLPGLLMFLLTILITLLILIGRQAGVVLLVVISPLAFASWILPNTEQWFKKWQKMLLGLLLVYPAVALLFGAGGFASTVLSANATNDGLMQIAALIVSALPLIATPSLLKGSMNALGTIGAKFSNLGSSTMSSLNKKRMETSKEKRANLRNDFMNRDFSGQGKSRGIIRRTGRAFARGGQKILRYSDQVKRDRKLKTDLLQSDRDQQYKQGLMADHTAGTLGKRLGSAVDTAAGKGMMEKLRSEAIGNVEATLKASSINDLKDALQQALKSNDSTTAIAVQNQLLKRGSAGITAFEGAMSDYEKGSSPMSSEIRQDLATNIRESHAGTMDKSLALGQWAIGSESIDDSRTTALNNLAASGMTIEKFSALTEQSQTDLLKSGRAILSQKQLNNLSYPRGALAEKVSPAVSAAAKGAVPKP